MAALTETQPADEISYESQSRVSSQGGDHDETRHFQSELLRQQEVQFRRIVSGTRLHLPAEAKAVPEATVDHLRRYATQARRLGTVTAIAVNSFVEEIRQIMLEAEPELQVHILHVPCWGAFVPALNALLNFAQRAGSKHILFQSLEVCCSREVLQLLLDYHDGDALVVGPVFDGHSFQEGEQPLNGRTSPWNTLALWSVRKLALTGFLSIADGLSDAPPSLGKSDSLASTDNPQDDSSSLNLSPMGSDSWWSGESVCALGFQRQSTPAPPKAVPAGVEEVTAIALLQHLHGSDRSRAVLVKLPLELEAQLSWKTTWGKDEKRRQWHQYKMASKLSRPAAQLQALFPGMHKSSSSPLVAEASASQQDGEVGDSVSSCNILRRTGGLFRRRTRSEDNLTDQATESPSLAATELAAGGPVQVGKVMHYGKSIRPPWHVKWICLMLCLLFYANSTAVLSTAFRVMNTRGAGTLGWADVCFVVVLLGGVYLPMPASLWMMRTVTRNYGHIHGILVSLGLLLLGHLMAAVGQAMVPSAWWPLLVARLVQGLSSGILFQTRHIITILSTSDHHVTLQSWIFLVSDLGLGFGALFPVFVHHTLGRPSPEAPELLPSLIFLVVTVCLGVWVMMMFPRRLSALPYRVRFPDQNWVLRQRTVMNGGDWTFQYTTWISGTTRIFVQSAIVPVLALSMRDAGWTGKFRQSMAVAAMFLLALPFEVLVSRICCSCGYRAGALDDTSSSKMISGAVGAGSLVLAGLQPRGVVGDDGEFMVLITRIAELGILMIALGMAAPFNASKLYQQKNAERSIVILEWMKAYIGRLLGPIFAVLLYNYVGYGMVLGMLTAATAVVTLTA